MVGVIWTIQLVHYPLMAMADRHRYRDFQAAHERRISVIVVPVMLTEAATATILTFSPGSPVAPSMAWTGVGLLGLIWASTFLIQVPLHRTLGRGFDAVAHRRLVRSNWLRTAAWTFRGLLMVAIAWSMC
jgi:hypothetical protein